MNLENHCGKSGCICTHTDPCERGFIWVEYYEEQKKTTADGNTKVTAQRYEGVQFCSTCSPERASIVATSRNSNEMGERLRARSNHQKLKSYEEDERSKTRTL